jgi:hypothetical protein
MRTEKEMWEEEEHVQSHCLIGSMLSRSRSSDFFNALLAPEDRVHLFNKV